MKVIELASKSIELVSENETFNNNLYLHVTLLNTGKKSIEIAKSISVLISSDSVAGVQSLIRVLIENLIQIRYITLEDSENRAKAYFINDELSVIRMLNAINEKGEYGKKVRKFTGITKKEAKEYINTKVSPKDTLLEEYNSLFHHEKPRTWYDFDGKTDSLEQLSRKTDTYPYYASFYRILSREIHSLGLTGDIHPLAAERVVTIIIAEIINDLLDVFDMTARKNGFNMSVEKIVQKLS